MGVCADEMAGINSLPQRPRVDAVEQLASDEVYGFAQQAIGELESTGRGHFLRGEYPAHGEWEDPTEEANKYE